nr:hypothetical protein GCM10020185_19890 [Pseudomonas brassicacearum subsp. brassicacearum]
MLLPITLPTAMSAFLRQGCLQADGHLWGAAAERDDAQADDQWSYLQACRQAHGGAHQQFGAADQQQQGAEQFDQAEQR